MQERILAVIALLLALSVAALALWWHPEPPVREVPRPGLPAGGDFVLATASGKVALTDFRGRLLVLSFGYTACPDICPTTLAGIADAFAQLEPDELKRSASLFVSVDPQRDTPQHLQQYVQFFNPAFIGATGEPAVLADIARRYGVFYNRPDTGGSDDNYAIDHSADIYLIDGNGRITDKIAHGTTSTAIAQAIRKQLQATP